MKTTIKSTVLFGAAAIFLIMYSAGCSNRNSALVKAEIDSLKNQITEIIAARSLTNQYLDRFDTLDFIVYSNQLWSRLHESHSPNIVVYWPDGRIVKGLDQHIEDLKAMFVFAPDTKITEHPIRFGSGKFTAVTGIMEGSFSKSMPVGNGNFILPTNKKFRLPMATIGVWENGVMVEEHLFWDNHSLMTQIGVAK